MINAYTTRGLMDQGQVEEIEMSMQYILQNHPARAEYHSSEEFDNMLEDTNPF
jgi:membrane-bound lytic murein transglycosylase